MSEGNEPCGEAYESGGKAVLVFFYFSAGMTIDFIRKFEYNQFVNNIVNERTGRDMEYMTANEAAEKWGISSRRVHTLCNEGRIESAARLGNAWAIPKDAVKPNDGRIKSGKYVKSGDK
jgi:hypothetical protein